MSMDVCIDVRAEMCMGRCIDMFINLTLTISEEDLCLRRTVDGHVARRVY